jgi:hypothetical protein
MVNWNHCPSALWMSILHPVVERVTETRTSGVYHLELLGWSPVAEPKLVVKSCSMCQTLTGDVL